MYENIVDKVNNQEWMEAIKEISKEMSNDNFDEELSVLAGTVLLAVGKTEKAREVIAKGLAINYKNYELWLTLGQTYEAINVNQAYLCYENALLYCNSLKDSEVIIEFMKCVRESVEFAVRKVAIVVLSYNSLHYTKECIASIRNTCLETSYEIIVVDNASSDDSVDWLKKQKDIKLLCNNENVGFPKGCNQGIEIAEKDSDIFLLNNDAILTPNALFWLRMGLYENCNVGATGARSNCVSNFQKVDWNCSTKEDYFAAAKINNLPMERPYEEKIYLVGFAMLISRKALNVVGYLDEIFSPGTYEDNDMGFKLRCHGFDVLLCHNSFIYHYGSGGGSNVEKWNRLSETNSKKLSQKWGFNTSQYNYIRYDIINKISADSNAPLKILEVGCGLGMTLLALKAKYPNAELYGWEKNKCLLPFIPKCINVMQLDFNNGKMSYDSFFDLIIVEDEFAICQNTVKLVERLGRCLQDEGILITGVSNLRKKDILLLNNNVRKSSRIAMCLYTHNHKKTIEYLLPNICMNYLIHGIDVYVMDSSEDEETHKLIQEWVKKGFTNLFYYAAKGYNIQDKLIESFSNPYFAERYDYIWPCKDRTIWPIFTLDAISDSIDKQDLVYLEVRGDNNLPERQDFEGGIELYKYHSLGLTSIDTTLYRTKTFCENKEIIRKIVQKTPSFPHFYYALYIAAEKSDACICVLQGKRVHLYNINLSGSEWGKQVFEVWKDKWVAVNDLLPDCYAPYKEFVIKFVASQPWLLGGKEKLQELKDKKILTPEILTAVQTNWERVSDIPFEYVKNLAESK